MLQNTFSQTKSSSEVGDLFYLFKKKHYVSPKPGSAVCNNAKYLALFIEFASGLVALAFEPLNDLIPNVVGCYLLNSKAFFSSAIARLISFISR